MKLNKLTKEEQFVILQKGTETPSSGKYNNFFGKGTYNCKQCGANLYKSSTADVPKLYVQIAMLI